jgi:transaldolase/glucose-6-phosphate isomerase
LAEAALGPIAAQAQEALAEIAREEVIQRLWRKDYTLWSDDPTEITRPNRLGWLDVVDSIGNELSDLRQFAAEVAGEGYRTAVLLGMGGSSLAPEVLQSTFGTQEGMLSLVVLDTTHPESISNLTGRLDLASTLFIVASKSGSTVETLSQFDYFWGLVPDGRHFVAITDEGTSLQSLGEKREFRRVFINRPDIGGRYSALSFFGMLPAALIGADLEGLLRRARSMALACRGLDAADNPGAYLGTILGEAALAGRNKLTLVLPQEIAAFGDWVEQLLAESTGKLGRGILPVVGEAPLAPDDYGSDRLFFGIGEEERLKALERAGQPVVSLPYDGPAQLGAEFFRWEFATAMAGQRLHINPFDQPDVQSAKDATSRILEQGPAAQPAGETPQDLLKNVKPGDYIAILAFLPRDPDTQAALQQLRGALGSRYGVTTTLGFGPRYLHSTGQLHKGGPGSGVFLLLTDEPDVDVAIRGRPYTFQGLWRAQALGDLESLRSAGRRVAFIDLGRDRFDGIERLRRVLA